MKRIVIVHGWDGSSKLDWLPSAVEEFKKLGYEVLCPDMPHTEKPTMEEWVPFLTKLVGKPDENTYFIGHSIGCQTIMRYLETIDTRVGGAIFVAGWFDLKNLEGPEAEKIAQPWIDRTINMEKVKTNLQFSVALLGDNDPWVPYAMTKEKFERLLGSTVINISGKGHMTSDDGYGPFNRLITLTHQYFSGIELLEIVNEQDEFIALESRQKVHQGGLLHREINIWFITLNQEIVFQHRAKDKDTYPDLLDASVGGHVDPGMSYDETAVKETLEETGLTVSLNNLKPTKKIINKSIDDSTKLINYTIRQHYLYLFEGNISDLIVEQGKAIGFEAWKIDSLSKLSDSDKKRFIPTILSEEMLNLFEEGRKLFKLI